VLRSDLDLMFQRQSRFPDLVALDLRAQIAGCRVARQALLEMCAECGAARVKTTMRRTLDNAQRSFQEKLRRIPDATFRDVRYFHGRLPGDRRTYKMQIN